MVGVDGLGVRGLGFRVFWGIEAVAWAWGSGFRSAFMVFRA